MEQVYFVRYGLMHHVGRFRPESGEYRRGQTVVVRTRRGTELGEVLAHEAYASSAGSVGATILREAGVEDLERARLAELERPGRLAACERIFRDGAWPLDLVDVEPLLDDRRTVLHYLGPHHLDDSGLRQVLRDSCGLDALLEPVGLDEPDEVEDEGHGCGSGSCDSGSCGSGGCGSGDHGGGCAGCAVKELVGRRRPAATH
jgi:hypothetical protein